MLCSRMTLLREVVPKVVWLTKGSGRGEEGSTTTTGFCWAGTTSIIVGTGVVLGTVGVGSRTIGIEIGTAGMIGTTILSGTTATV